MKRKSKCTVGFLVSAAQMSYKIGREDTVDLSINQATEIAAEMRDNGYSIERSIAPIRSQGTGQSPLAAVCLKSDDPDEPIIISYRGTHAGGDVVSDARLTMGGVVEKKFRDAAFDFYQQVRKQYPNKEIVITGHSLGGHLAQYVGTKAYNTDPKLQANHLVQVRTFNSAPVDTKHGEVFERQPELSSQFVNYRLSPDVVSNLPLHQHYGNTFVFPSNQNALNSHKLGVVKQLLPEHIKNQEITAPSPIEKQKNMLVELVKGVESSYQCRVEGQFFSRYRAGAKNLEQMQKAFPEVIELIEKGKYNEAVLKLDDLKDKLDGTVSKQLVDAIRQRTVDVKISQQMDNAETLATGPQIGATDNGKVAPQRQEPEPSPVVNTSIPTAYAQQRQFKSEFSSLRSMLSPKEEPTLGCDNDDTPTLTCN